MSIVYNNGRAIGKCKSYEIEKVQGSKDFVKMVDFEPFDRLDKNQRILLEWLKMWHHDDALYTVADLYDTADPDARYPDEVDHAYGELKPKQQYEVLAAFVSWGMSQEVAE